MSHKLPFWILVLALAFGGHTQALESPVVGGKPAGEIVDTLPAEPSVITIHSHTLDRKALVGLPVRYAEQTAAYVGQILKLLDARPYDRTIYVNEQKTGMAEFPLDTFAVAKGSVPVELVLLPRPESVRSWLARPQSVEAGWKPAVTATFDKPPYQGKTLLFRRGKLSKNPATTFATPHGTSVNEGVYAYGECFLEAGKLVTPNPGISIELQLGKKGGAVLIADLRTRPAHPDNTRVWLTSLMQDGFQTISVAYALVDGNGGQREQLDERVSPFVRPLKCPLHQPKTGPHDLLLLSTPIDWKGQPVRPYEDWALDEWFGQQKTGCWVLREAEDSKPLQESFLLLSGSEESVRPPYQIIVFPETPPEQLIRELAAVYRVTENVAKISAESMKELETQFQQLGRVLK
jgi:hypothetical protein